MKKKAAKTYWVFESQIFPRHYDLALALLNSAGAGSLEEKKKAGRIELAAEVSFFPEKFLKKIETLQKDWGFSDLFIDPKIQKIDRGDWAEKYEKFLKPFLFLPEQKQNAWKALWINPHDQKMTMKNVDVFKIRSSLAFGTGSHPTTQLAGRLVRETLSQCPGAKVLDIGTGTGILAMVAEKYGGQKVVAVENDLEALGIAQENFAANACNPIEGLASLKKVKGKFNVVIANIILKTLVELHADIVSRVGKNCYLILSGLLYRDVIEILDVYSDFACLERYNRKGWSALLMKKR